MKRSLGNAAIGLFFALLMAALVAPAGAQVGGRAARPKVDLPGGPVRTIILKNCTRCHGIDDYAFFAMSRERWSDLISSIHDPLGVVVEEDDRELLLDFLVSRFGPDSQPFPRTYVPPEITEFFSDDEARAFIDTTCTQCHSAERVFETRHDLERWRAILVNMSQRGAELDDVELERLVEWLYRVRGTAPIE